MANEKFEAGNDPVDVHIGARVREARTKLGMRSAALARAIGVSERDVEDFEDGRRRIGAILLCDLCRALDLHISYFFREYAASSAFSDDDLTFRVSQLVSAFLNLSVGQQEEAYSLIQALAASDTDDDTTSKTD